MRSWRAEHRAGPPGGLLRLTASVFRQVRPEVRRCLEGWRSEAERIPDPELRSQALVSIESKAFHCEGGAVFGLLAGDRYPEAIRFVVAYQTMSDYLDNLCDRSTSLDAEDFRLLHRAMAHALTPGAEPEDYYRLRSERDDGGYLGALVTTCQKVLGGLSGYGLIAPHLQELAAYYCDLQVYKHAGGRGEREAALKRWFAAHQQAIPPMSWYEFSACAGSTLGIFCLVSEACGDGPLAGSRHPVAATPGPIPPEADPRLPAADIARANFPWVQGLHILLDYFIDQDEDRRNGDLNFCSYYSTQQELVSRLSHFYRQANVSVSRLPHASFHRLVNQGLVALYCSDGKVRRQPEVRAAAARLVFAGGGKTAFLYYACLLYRAIGRR